MFRDEENTWKKVHCAQASFMVKVYVDALCDLGSSLRDCMYEAESDNWYCVLITLIAANVAAAAAAEERPQRNSIYLAAVQCL